MARPAHRFSPIASLPLLCALTACGASPEGTAGEGLTADADASVAARCAPGDAATREDGRVVGGAYATEVVSFTPGPGATFGHRAMPDIVLGPPQGRGDRSGSTDVVSLGLGGTIVLGFDRDIVDGPGADFVVFENAFVADGREQRVWMEFAEVSVSEDGARWVTFRCDPAGSAPFTGCAGWSPVYASAESGYCALDPRVSGGDFFDLAAVGVTRARFVRIRDLQTLGAMPPASGFDLDAVGVLHRR